MQIQYKTFVPFVKQLQIQQYFEVFVSNLWCHADQGNCTKKESWLMKKNLQKCNFFQEACLGRQQTFTPKLWIFGFFDASLENISSRKLWPLCCGTQWVSYSVQSLFSSVELVFPTLMLLHSSQPFLFPLSPTENGGFCIWFSVVAYYCPHVFNVDLVVLKKSNLSSNSQWWSSSSLPPQ